MFQQFKNIFPSTSLNIRSLTESIGLPDSEWTRGVDRLEALKNEFANLNTFLSNRQDSSDNLSTSNNSINTDSQSVLELKATAEMIEKLQQGWDDIHENNKLNYTMARKANVMLRQLDLEGQNCYNVCQQIGTVSDSVTEMQSNLEIIQQSAVDLASVLAKLEEQIDAVSVDYEKQEFEEWKEDQEFQLIEEINNRKMLLKEKEQRLKQQYEECDITQQKKRLELYEANFNAELEDYRRKRETEVSSLYSQNGQSEGENSTRTALKQLNLESSEGTKDLDLFLGEPVANVVIDKESKKKKEKREKKDKKKKSKPTASAAPQVTSSDEDDGKRVEVLQDEDYVDF